MTALEYFERRKTMKNGEGYADPTPGKAIRRTSFLPDFVWDVVKILKDVCRLSRLRIKYIELEDIDTGKEYQWQK